MPALGRRPELASSLVYTAREEDAQVIGAVADLRPSNGVELLTRNLPDVDILVNILNTYGPEASFQNLKLCPDPILTPLRCIELGLLSGPLRGHKMNSSVSSGGDTL